MWKSIISFCLLLVLLAGLLSAQSSPNPEEMTDAEIIAELQASLQRREKTLNERESLLNEREQSLTQREADLNERENSIAAREAIYNAILTYSTNLQNELNRKRILESIGFTALGFFGRDFLGRTSLFEN